MPTRANNFQATLTQAEKDAATRACVVDGLSSKEVARRAAAGELEGAGRFTISDAYVRRLSTRHKAQHQPARLAQPGEADKAITEARARVLAWILHELARLETEAKTGKPNLPAMGRVLRAMAEYDRTKPEGKSKPQPGREDNTQLQSENTADQIVARLLERSNGATSNGESAASLARDEQTPSGGHSA